MNQFKLYLQNKNKILKAILKKKYRDITYSEKYCEGQFINLL